MGQNNWCSHKQVKQKPDEANTIVQLALLNGICVCVSVWERVGSCMYVCTCTHKTQRECVCVLWILVECLSTSRWQLHGAIICFLADSVHSSCMWMWLSLSTVCFSLYIHWCDVLTALFACYMAGAIWYGCRLLSARSVYTLSLIHIWRCRRWP